MKAKYEQLESTGKCKKRALTAVMRKLIEQPRKVESQANIPLI
jgi:hypothetical protein